MTVKELKKELNRILRENPDAGEYNVRLISLSQVGYCDNIEVDGNNREVILEE